MLCERNTKSGSLRELGPSYLPKNSERFHDVVSLFTWKIQGGSVNWLACMERLCDLVRLFFRKSQGGGVTWSICMEVA